MKIQENRQNVVRALQVKGCSFAGFKMYTALLTAVPFLIQYKVAGDLSR
jgi:hypothetical protein